MTEGETKDFESKMNAWLDSNGFVPTQDPGGMVSWAGVHSADDIVTWYRGKIEDSPDFLIRISKLPRPGIRKGAAEFDVSHAWAVTGSKDLVESAEEQSHKFAAEFMGWIEAYRPNKSP